MKRLGIACCFFICSSAGADLRPASSTVETLAGGSDRTWPIALPVGQTMELQIVERQAMAGIVSMLDRNGAELVQVDLNQRSPTGSAVLLPPEAASLRVRAVNRSSLVRVFEIRTSVLVPLGDRERRRIEAERLLGQGEAVHREQQPGYFQTARASYEKALAVWTELADRRGQAEALAHIGYVDNESGDAKNALAHCRQALELWTAAKDESGIGRALGQMAWIAGTAGPKDKAEEWANRSLEIRRSLGEVRAQIDVLFVLENLRFVDGRTSEAQSYTAEALALAEKAGDRRREIDARNLMGLIQYQLGNGKEAADAYNAALALARDEGDNVRVAMEFNNLGALYYANGEIRQAIAAYEQAAPIRKAVAPANSYANTLYNLALAYADIGDFQRALEQYNESLAIFRRSGYARGEGFVFRGMGNLYLVTGDEAKAEDLFRQAKARWGSASDRRGEILALNSLGDIASHRREFSEAIKLHNQALAIAKAAGYQAEEERSLGYLAKAALEGGDARAALQRSSEELEIAQKIEDKIGESAALHEQGRAWRNLADLEKARRCLEQAMELRAAIGTRVPEAQTRYELAALERGQGNIPAAWTHITRALELVDAAGASIGGRESRMLYAASVRRIYDLAIDIAMGRREYAVAFELSEHARARGLVDLLREARLDIREGVDPALLSRERDIQELLDGKHERLLQMLAAAHKPARELAARKELDELIDRYHAVETEIRLRSPRYAALMQPPPLSLADVQSRLLDSSTALIEFWLGEERSYGWLVTPAHCVAFELPPRHEVEALAAQVWHALNARNETPVESLEQRANRVAAADAGFQQNVAALSRILLGPIATKLSSRRLWIASDGALDYVPFAALPLPSGAGPLISAHDVVRIPSAAAVAVERDESARRIHPTRSVVIFADPVYSPNDERVTKAGGLAPPSDASRNADDVDLSRLARLHFSRLEADSIAALNGPGVREELDFKANRAEVLDRDLARFRIVHFAAHAVVDNRHPELSGIVLSTVDGRGRARDGFLRLHEIYNLELNADLVVLSACETALGQEIRGEGMIGLTRGFFYAGAPQVMASLWAVNDRATAELMRRFYEGLLKRGLPPETALRNAQLSLMRDPRWKQPYYWAAFTVQGAR